MPSWTFRKELVIDDQLRPILAATDFSALARHAADRAARLAQREQSSVTLIHVVPGDALQSLRQWIGSDPEIERRLLDDARQQLQPLAEDLNLSRQVPIRPVVASGRVLDELIGEADKLDAELLVLGNRGTGFLGRAGLGSTSERLLRRTTRPLLIVRRTPLQDYRRVLLPLDFSPWTSFAISLARRVAPDAHYVLLSVFEVPFAEKLRFAGVDADTVDIYRRQAQALATQRLHAAAKAAGLQPGQWDCIVVEGDAAPRIVEQEQEQDCDLVVLGKHGQSAAEDLLLGSVSLRVLSEGSTDVLVSTAREP